MQTIEKTNLDYLFEGTDRPSTNINSIITGVTESQLYAFHRFERNKLMNGHIGSVNTQLISGKRYLQLFNRYYNRTMNSEYDILGNTTRIIVRQDASVNKWISRFIVDLRTLLNSKGIFKHLSVQFQVDEFTMWIHNDLLEMEYEKKVDGLAFMDTYDSIRVIKELDKRFSFIKSTFKANTQKILDFYKTNDVQIDDITGTIIGDPIFITDILG